MFIFLQTENIALAQAPHSDSWTPAKANAWFQSKTWAKGLKWEAHPSVNRLLFAQQYHRHRAMWNKAFAFLKTPNLDTLSPGKYPIDGDNVFAIITEAPPKPFEQTAWESHHHYVDLQCVLKGREKIGMASLTGATITTPYDESKDLAHYSANGKYYLAQPGTFFLFFPQNAHRPSIKVEGGEWVKKLVIKIRMAE